MLRLLIGALCGGIILSVTAGTASAASFDCSKSSTRIEKSICSDKALGDKDKQVAQLYAKAAESMRKEELKAEQRGWIARRNKCEDTACLLAAYDDRIIALELTISDQTKLIFPAEKALLSFPAQSNDYPTTHRTRPVSIVGKVQLANGPAGGGYDLVVGNSHLTFRYIWDLSDEQNALLDELDEAATPVRMVGMVQIYSDDGNIDFAADAPISIYKVK